LRAVRYLAEQGIDQFIDIGSGVPMRDNVYEIIADGRSQATVVYVDMIHWPSLRGVLCWPATTKPPR
jgi:hypothetical protein